MELSQKINELVEKSIGIQNWINRRLDGLNAPSSRRVVVAMSCFTMVLEHQISIAKLIEIKLNGSALALVRCAYEAYIRGLWLQKCATDSQISSFLKDKLELSLSKMIEQIEAKPGFEEGVLSTTKKNHWKTFCSFTHTGAVQVSSRWSDRDLISNYSENDILLAMNFANMLSLMAFVAICDELKQLDLAKGALEKMKE